MLDLRSFALGFVTGPVGYVLFGAAVYGVLSLWRWLCLKLLGNKS